MIVPSGRSSRGPWDKGLEGLRFVGKSGSERVPGLPAPGAGASGCDRERHSAA